MTPSPAEIPRPEKAWMIFSLAIARRQRYLSMSGTGECQWATICRDAAALLSQCASDLRMFADVFLTGQSPSRCWLKMMFCCGSEEEFRQACAWRPRGTPSDRPPTFGWKICLTNAQLLLQFILKHWIPIVDQYGRWGWELERKASGPGARGSLHLDMF